MKIFFTILGAISAVILIAFVIASYYMYRLACVRDKKFSTTVWENDEFYNDFSKLYAKCGEDIVNKRLALRDAGRHPSTERLTVTSHDGLKLCARLIPHGGKFDSPRGIVAFFHGYRSEPTRDFGTFAMDIHNMGFMLLMPDQRAHGGSEGRHITFGVKERLDAVKWCEKLNELYPEFPVILYGLSMGASTVLMASELKLPENVCAVVADCGFTTPAAICEKVLKADLHLPKFPIYYGAELLVRLLAGYSFNAASAVDAIRNTNLPVLIIHGENDKFVPHTMGLEISGAADCDFLSVPQAGHGEAYLYNPEGYIEAFKKLARRGGVADI